LSNLQNLPHENLRKKTTFHLTEEKFVVTGLFATPSIELLD
jgi:hypothetical protein